MFQYISCYSLSSYKMIERTDKYCFNTSHVTLYLSGLLRRLKPNGCFNTSHVTLYQNTISGSPAIRPSFNTSHVTLYPSSETTCISRYRGFNTSHVTLYRKCGSGVVYQPMVSIHLMLLFIRHDLDEKGIAYPFQYISCYSLSGHQAINACLTSAFQYISCYSLSRGFSALPWP